jgi:hypothetical protein
MSLNTMTGPCQICGATEYPLSFGGPSICPACDCGIPPEVTKVHSRIASLERELAAALKAKEELEEKLKNNIYTKTDAEAMCEIAVAGERVRSQLQAIRDGKGNVGAAEQICKFLIAESDGFRKTKEKAEAERDAAVAETIERCAKVCEERAEVDAKHGRLQAQSILDRCATAIRALAPSKREGR